MILVFSKPEFKDRILAKTKIHTIRKDRSKRWQVGSKIEFWLHNPINVSLHPHEFAKSHIREKTPIMIFPKENKVSLGPKIIKDIKELNQLAVNDGFLNWEDMKTWFTENFSGYLLTWSQQFLTTKTSNKNSLYYAKQTKLEF